MIFIKIKRNGKTLEIEKYEIYLDNLNLLTCI